jgi:hypothetical protein
MMGDRGAFVFADDGVDFFQTVEEASGYVEAIDVHNREYEAFFALTGEPLRPEILDGIKVQLRPSGIADLDALRNLLRCEQDRRGTFLSDPDDPTAVANEILLGKWSTRWPKWPKWLDRRLHGERPPRV